MNTFVSVTVHECTSLPECSYAYIYVSMENSKLEFHHRISYDEGMQELQKLAAQLGREPETRINQYNNTIVSHTLHGFLS